MRHGHAQYVRGIEDSQRQLTAQGVEESERMGRHLSSELSGVDKLVSSPYIRAKQTLNAVLANRYNEREEWPEVTPYGDAEEIARMLAAQTVGSLLLVCHLPVVATLTHYLQHGSTLDAYDTAGFVPAEIACLEVDCAFPGTAEVLWRIQPEQVKSL